MATNPKLILIAPIKTTSDFVHYAVHEFAKGKMEAISTKSFTVNKMESGLPPYTLRVPRMNHTMALERMLRTALAELSSKKNTYRILAVNGYNHTTDLLWTVNSNG